MARPSLKVNGFNLKAVWLQAPVRDTSGHGTFRPIGVPEFEMEELGEWVPLLSRHCGKRGASTTTFGIEDISVNKSAWTAKRTILKAMRPAKKGEQTEVDSSARQEKTKISIKENGLSQVAHQLFYAHIVSGLPYTYYKPFEMPLLSPQEIRDAKQRLILQLINSDEKTSAVLDKPICAKASAEAAERAMIKAMRSSFKGPA